MQIKNVDRDKKHGIRKKRGRKMCMNKNKRSVEKRRKRFIFLTDDDYVALRSGVEMVNTRNRTTPHKTDRQADRRTAALNLYICLFVCIFIFSISINDLVDSYVFYVTVQSRAFFVGFIDNC